VPRPEGAQSEGRPVDVRRRDRARRVSAPEDPLRAVPLRGQASLERPCATITAKVDCGSCHPAVVTQYAKSTHGKLVLRGDENGPPARSVTGRTA